MLTKKPHVSIVLPIYNEQTELRANTLMLHTFLKQHQLPFSWDIVIADNASTDQSGCIGRSLDREYDTISYIYIEEKGRGRAVKFAWQQGKADYFAYMDIDLSTDLRHLPALIQALMAGYSIAIGSRLLTESNVSKRPLKREILSRCYNMLIKLLFQTKFSDAQCGFKAIKKEVWDKISPLIQDNDWFFDSELLIIADKIGFKITEVPIVWRDDPASTVKVAKTAWGDIKGLIRLFLTRPWRKLKTG